MSLLQIEYFFLKRNILSILLYLWNEYTQFTSDYPSFIDNQEIQEMIHQSLYLCSEYILQRQQLHLSIHSDILVWLTQYILTDCSSQLRFYFIEWIVTYCNDLTSAIKVYGEVAVNKPGKYKVTYSCENTDGNKRDVSINVKVVAADSDEAMAITPEPTTTPQQTVTPEPTAAPQQTATPQPTVVPTQAPTTVPPTQTPVPTQKTTTTVQIVDNVAPTVRFVANSAYVSSLDDN